MCEVETDKDIYVSHFEGGVQNPTINEISV